MGLSAPREGRDVSSTLLAETSVAAVVSLLFFFSLFVGIVVWVLMTGKSGRWKRDARMPLDDDDSTSRQDKDHG